MCGYAHEGSVTGWGGCWSVEVMLLACSTSWLGSCGLPPHLLHAGSNTTTCVNGWLASHPGWARGVYLLTCYMQEAVQHPHTGLVGKWASFWVVGWSPGPTTRRTVAVSPCRVESNRMAAERTLWCRMWAGYTLVVQPDRHCTRWSGATGAA